MAFHPKPQVLSFLLFKLRFHELDLIGLGCLETKERNKEKFPSSLKPRRAGQERFNRAQQASILKFIVPNLLL